MTRPSTPTLRPPAPADDKRQRVLEAALKRTGYKQDALIEVLHSAQNTFGFLTPELLWYVAAQLRVPPSRVYGVATFYNFFSLKPPGEHTVTVCQGTVCYIRGARAIIAGLERCVRDPPRRDQPGWPIVGDRGALPGQLWPGAGGGDRRSRSSAASRQRTWLRASPRR